MFDVHRVLGLARLVAIVAVALVVIKFAPIIVSHAASHSATYSTTAAASRAH
jgi:hypothetical protein